VHFGGGVEIAVCSSLAFDAAGAWKTEEGSLRARSGWVRLPGGKPGGDAKTPMNAIWKPSTRLDDLTRKAKLIEQRAEHPRADDRAGAKRPTGSQFQPAPDFLFVLFLFPGENFLQRRRWSRTLR